jgi:hypothetical protein
METKICSRCGEEKDITEFVKNKKCNLGFSGTCKKCHNIYSLSNPEKVKKSRDKWKKNNPEKVKESRDKWEKNNPEKVILKHKKLRSNLVDYYVIRKLCAKGFQKNQITPELIETQRLIIKIKRLCKTSQN